MVLSSLGGEPLVLIKEFNFHQKDRSPCVYVIGLKKGKTPRSCPMNGWRISIWIAATTALASGASESV